MKRITVWASGLCLLILGSGVLSAQELKEAEINLETEEIIAKTKEDQERSISNIKITKYTIMSAFEPDYVISAEERLEQKKQRIVDTYHKRNMLDTMDISERRRKRLMRDLRSTPFSNRLNKAVVADTKFEDTDDIQEDK